MATISITIDDTKVPRVLAAFAATYGDLYPGLSGALLVKAVLAGFAREVAVAFETEQAGHQAEAQARASATTDFGGIA